MILALDTATTVGWAVGNPGDTPRWGARNFAGDGGTGEVVCKFHYWLMSACDKAKPSIICYEARYIPARHGGPPTNVATLRRLLALAAQVEAVAWELRIECRESTVAEITKFFTGRVNHGGRDNKKAATIAMCARYGWDTVSDDAADALALWAMAEAKISPAHGRLRGVGPLFLPKPLTKRKPGVVRAGLSLEAAIQPGKSKCTPTRNII